MLPTDAPVKKLYRSRKDKMIAGVCGGLAERYNIDSTWVRLAFVILFFFGGCALLIYGIMWMIVPVAPA
ncbi:MAG: PspC domain-containing protein [Pseudomonadota bacterium]